MLLPTSLAIILCSCLVNGATTSTKKTAECEIKSDSGAASEPIQGKITFTETEGSDLQISISLSGFNSTDANTEHGFHVHQNGELGNMCKDAGGHYNPLSKTHGGPTDAVRHVGDLGNVPEVNGKVVKDMTDNVASLFGQYTILNRAIVVHAKADDLGKGNAPDSNTTGAAGARLGCCKIMDTSGALLYGGSLSLLLVTLISALDRIFS